MLLPRGCTKMNESGSMASMYEIWFGEIKFPVAPAKIQTSINGNNKTVSLINESEVNQLKGTKLTDFSFDLMLPGARYPFAVYSDDGFQRPDYYLGVLEQLKINRKPFKFKVLRHIFSGAPSFDTSLNVSLEDYKIIEDAEDGLDITVEIELKKYVKFGTKKIKIKKKVFQRSNVDTTKKKIVKSYTSKKGDTLLAISRKVYGIGNTNNAGAIYKKNKKKVDRALKSKFRGKFSKRIYTTALPVTVCLTIPARYDRLEGKIVKR